MLLLFSVLCVEPRFVSQVLLLCTGDELTLKETNVVCEHDVHWGVEGVEEHACTAWRSEDHREQLRSQLSLPPRDQGVE